MHLLMTEKFHTNRSPRGHLTPRRLVLRLQLVLSGAYGDGQVCHGLLRGEVER